MIKRLFDKLLIIIVPLAGYLLIRFIFFTMRKEYIGFERVRTMWRNGRGVILAFWHGRLAMMPPLYVGRGMTVLISQHRDGELVSRMLRCFGIDSARGSTTRGWFGGMKRLLEAARNGLDIAITPDGPRGPRFKVQTGIIQIAAKTGMPIIPVSFGASKKKPLRAGMPS